MRTPAYSGHQARVPNHIQFTYVEYAPAIYRHLRIMKLGRPCAVPLHKYNAFIICVLRTDGTVVAKKFLVQLEIS